MSRQRKPYYVQQKVSLPATLVARFARFHWDPVHNKIQYGAISDVLAALLTDYVNRMENPAPQDGATLVPTHPAEEKVDA